VRGKGDVGSIKCELSPLKGRTRESRRAHVDNLKID
jgi:hypothetical protein